MLLPCRRRAPCRARPPSAPSAALRCRCGRPGRPPATGTRYRGSGRRWTRSGLGSGIRCSSTADDGSLCRRRRIAAVRNRRRRRPSRCRSPAPPSAPPSRPSGGRPSWRRHRSCAAASRKTLRRSRCRPRSRAPGSSCPAAVDCSIPSPSGPRSPPRRRWRAAAPAGRATGTGGEALGSVNPNARGVVAVRERRNRRGAG